MWPESMGYYTSRELPVTDFLARNFLVCDRWFAPLPASTQPNRLMAMSGFTRSRVTGDSMLAQELVYHSSSRRRSRDPPRLAQGMARVLRELRAAKEAIG